MGAAQPRQQSPSISAPVLAARVEHFLAARVEQTYIVFELQILLELQILRQAPPV
jgi:hypothetical protein